MKKIFSLILVIALLSAMFMGTAVQASGTATVTLSSTYAENGQYEVTATLSGGTVTNGEVILNVGTNVAITSLTSTFDTDAQYKLSNGVLTFIFATEAVDATQAKELFKATFEIAAGVDASAVVAPSLNSETKIQYLATDASTPVDFDVTLNTEGFDLIEDVTPPAPTVLLGDVNEDGNVTVQDAQRLYEHLNGSDPLETTSNGYLAADVNQDGNVTVQDAQRLYEHLNGSDPLE